MHFLPHPVLVYIDMLEFGNQLWSVSVHESNGLLVVALNSKIMLKMDR
jgi:hypothetical protein